ncbi:hypothetical protein Ga0074812_11513 [Parafrankia irregularis]|uniref:Uncharacterized protein n=1 Tax=Parafrankia irregularis TaxID=795642 RepID=A0A0S4QR86_9ACTN|nr:MULTISPECIES: NUDIX domain-containing protein [Parafrankia]MBE3202629.1 NUDIX domain-containing protein [Parafrankia sp. CH37]CUU57812.1 hypothetical protein Ga0074812_11513 [Parafrankia irregularis]
MNPPRPARAQGHPGATPEPTLRARVFLTLGNRVVVANHRGQPWFFLLGEHVAPGEGVEQVLHRVLRRTAGFEVRALDFVGGMERHGTGRGTGHEIDVLFAGAVPRYAEFGSRVNEVDLVTVERSDLHRVEFRPAYVGDVISSWLADRVPRWYTDGGSTRPPTVATS